MSIVKQTFREALRRRWKLSLCVFLLGALLAVLTNTVDISETLDEMEGAAETVSETAEEDLDEIPTEELGQLARGAGLLAVVGGLAMLFSLGVVVVGSFMPAGLVGNDFFRRRYGGVHLATLLVMVLFGITAAARGTAGETDLAARFGLLLNICTHGAVACAVSFAFAALGARRAAWLGLAYYLGSGLVSVFASLVTAVAGGEVLRTLLQFVIFPSASIRSFARGFQGTWDWGATGFVVYHLALWSALAWMGVRKAAQEGQQEAHP